MKYIFLTLLMKSNIFKILFIIALITISFSSVTAQKKKRKKNKESVQTGIILTQEDKSSPYRIVIPPAATEHEKKAADVLQDYILRISEAVLPIIEADRAKSPYEIVLGQNERLDELGLNIDFNGLGKDGFIIMTDSLRLIIAGGNGKGTLYGVYTFLEKYLGCRMYSPDVKVIPEQKEIVIGNINDLEIPVIKFRDTHYRVTWNQEYSDWHKLNHDANGHRPDWGMWVHTFNTLVPPETYFKDHPEYYALRDGKRIPTQLCLSNPEVLKITIQNLRKKMALNPEATYWSVSQNDNRLYCQCDKCRVLDEQEGSPSGSIINFVNQVADKFPDKMISTLAYEYGRKAPKNIRPRKNVNIMLCSIEVNREKPIEQDTSSADFMKDVQDWGKIANDIIVWDYVIQFPNLISPFPNLQVLQPNIQFFVKNGVTAMFEQGNREVGGEFAELRAYLISKLLWNPELNVDSLMNDFLNGYYGASGKPIRKYIDTMREAVLASGAPLRIFGSPNQADTTYLSPALIDRYEQIFDDAETLAADSAELLERVRIARQPLNFAIMEQAKKNYMGERGIFHNVNGKWEIRTKIQSMIDPFVDLCVRQGVTRIKEWSTSPEAYRASMYRLFSKGVNEDLAFGKKVTFISPDSLNLPENAGAMLTDGKRGGHDYEYNWLVFAGKDLDLIIDLGEVKKIHKMESGYFQYGQWLRLFPEKVEYFVSTDGKEYEKVGTVLNTLPIDQYDGFQQDFITEFDPRKARFVRVVACTIGSTPADHPGGGRPANMLVDEIVVE